MGIYNNILRQILRRYKTFFGRFKTNIAITALCRQGHRSLVQGTDLALCGFSEDMEAVVARRLQL